MFRKLRADEIECRVQSVKPTGLILLLYKDARADMRLLDETVGAMNWQKSYSRDNSNCTVEIWDSEKAQWISKEDTGTESNTEAEKGKASDSFKRACFNWGIGRELYTAPFTWIDGKDCRINNGKCYDKFKVVDIDYDENGNICKLQISNDSIGRVVFNWEHKAEQTIDLSAEYASNYDKKRLMRIASELNLDIKKVCDAVGVADKMTTEQLGFAFKLLKEVEEGKHSNEGLV